MKKLPLFLLIIFLSGNLSGQVQDIFDNIRNVFENYNNAKKNIENCLDYFELSDQTNSLSSIQNYMRQSSFEISEAKKNASYSEDEMNDAVNNSFFISCREAKLIAEDVISNFADSRENLRKASDYLLSASNENDSESLRNYVLIAIDYILKANSELDSGNDEMINVINGIKTCLNETSSTSNQKRTCKELINYVESYGITKGKLNSYQIFESSWLKEVSAYTIDDTIVIIAEIKQDSYGFKTEKFIFCGISDQNWQAFYYGSFDYGKSYGERFRKYIYDYQCDCE